MSAPSPGLKPPKQETQTFLIGANRPATEKDRLSFSLNASVYPPTATAQDRAWLAVRIALGDDGRLRFTVPSTSDHYYVLYYRRDGQEATEIPVAMHLGEDGRTVLTEPLGLGRPQSRYRVQAYRRDQPDDLDGDGVDDVAELLDTTGAYAPLNGAPPIGFTDGVTAIHSRQIFRDLSYQGLDVLIDTHLEDLEFVKFYVLDADSTKPRVYFMNTNTHRSHGSFSRAVDLEDGGGNSGGAVNPGGIPGGGGRNPGGRIPGGAGGGIPGGLGQIPAECFPEGFDIGQGGLGNIELPEDFEPPEGCPDLANLGGNPGGGIAPPGGNQPDRGGNQPGGGNPRGGRGGGRGGFGGVPGALRGEIVYHPFLTGPSGEAGVYRYEYEPNDSHSFEAVQKIHEVIATNMPFLRNNLVYYPMPNAALPRYREEKALYDASRVEILLEEQIYADISFLPLNIAAGYGLLRLMDFNERPNSRDIVVYQALPNEMPGVGGVITTVPQTPLSHVNLRAAQDDVPNAYIQNFLEADGVADLIGSYVYYRVDADGYEIREATLDEVESHYIDRRPAETQFPERDLSITAFRWLDEIGFAAADAFGVKTANLATLRTFGFEEGVIPEGFGLPFYFYDEFMKHNGFYDRVEELLANPDFQSDTDTREKALADLRDQIKEGEMPAWMLDGLSQLQGSFSEGTSIRCRSSTNNEDLPGFSGAGLYDSYTHHPDEGHLSKSIKQVFASLWNFRAFEERTFFRIDHASAAMGVLLHPNFSGELANGVGVTVDPLYQTRGNYYLNTQIGEDLVTNPDAQSIPEEILVNARNSNNFTLVRPSNQVPDGQRLLSSQYLEALRAMLNTIHGRFGQLYSVSADEDFAMEIEYKITAEGNLAVKQARPWVF